MPTSHSPAPRHSIGITRRELLQVGYTGLLGISLPALLAQQARNAIGHQAVELWERSRFAALEDIGTQASIEERLAQGRLVSFEIRFGLRLTALLPQSGEFLFLLAQRHQRIRLALIDATG